MTTEPEVRWVYEPRWGQTAAVCHVTLGGRTESWASKSGLYISIKERENVPKDLEAKLRRTIRMFGPLLDDE